MKKSSRETSPFFDQQTHSVPYLILTLVLLKPSSEWTFWDSVREDDPKLKALTQEVDWVPWLSGGLGIFTMQWLGKLVHC